MSVVLRTGGFAGRVFDRTILSNIAIPELPPATDAVDRTEALEFHLSAASPPEAKWIDEAKTPSGETAFVTGKSAYGISVKFPDVVQFEVSKRCDRIVGYPLPGAQLSIIRHFLIDQVVPRVLAERGGVCLHGSCVDLGGAAIGFLGESGRGKSTLGSFFMKIGYKLLSDDAFLVAPRGEGYVSVPAYRGLRLWPDSLVTLDLPGESDALASSASKRRILLEPTQPEEVPLRAVFVLTEPIGETGVSVARVAEADALVAILRSCFTLDARTRRSLVRQFSTVAPIASSLPVYSLSYPRSFEFLECVSKAVLIQLGVSVHDHSGF